MSDRRRGWEECATICVIYILQRNRKGRKQRERMLERAACCTHSEFSKTKIKKKRMHKKQNTHTHNEHKQ